MSRRTNTAKMSVDRSCQLRQKTRLRRVWSLALWIFQSSFDVDDDYHDADDDYDWAFNDYDDAFYNLQLEGGLWAALGRCQHLWAKKRSCYSINSYSTSNRHLNPSESVRTIGPGNKTNTYSTWQVLSINSICSLAFSRHFIRRGPRYLPPNDQLRPLIKFVWSFTTCVWSIVANSKPQRHKSICVADHLIITT